jgi:DNA invertase Pin-like site-specific DNA recombinase
MFGSTTASGGWVARPQPTGINVVTTISSDADPRTGETQPDGQVRGPFRLSAIGYLRVSTDQQELGLEAQRASLTAAAARFGFQLRDVFVDAGISGALALQARPLLVEAVSALRRGEVLLVAKRDRLGRDPIGVAMIERLIAKRGARVISAAGEGTDNDEPSNLLMRRLIDAFAEYERLIIAARTKAALAAKRDKHERVGTLPFGSQLGADGVHLEPAPLEQRVLDHIQMLKAEYQSSRQIAAELNARGWTTRRGTAWRREYIARRLKAVS